MGEQSEIKITRPERPGSIMIVFASLDLPELEARAKHGTLAAELKPAMAELRDGLDALYARCEGLGLFAFPTELRFRFTGFASVSMSGD
jgi:hypothetical protein